MSLSPLANADNEPIRASRRERHKAATRHKLLAAAHEMIAEKGYNNVDIPDITERADVSKATFYKHFANLEDCVRELMLQGFDALVERILSGAKTAASRDEWALASFRDAFEWAQANRTLLLVMVGGAASARLNAFGRNYLVSIIDRSVREFGNPVSGARYSAEITGQVVTGVFIQLLGWWLEEDTGKSADDMARLMLDVIINGLGSISP